jgi:hypothetical protein
MQGQLVLEVGQGGHHFAVGFKKNYVGLPEDR